jgi:hypothetical protein
MSLVDLCDKNRGICITTAAFNVLVNLFGKVPSDILRQMIAMFISKDAGEWHDQVVDYLLSLDFDENRVRMIDEFLLIVSPGQVFQDLEKGVFAFQIQVPGDIDEIELQAILTSTLFKMFNHLSKKVRHPKEGLERELVKHIPERLDVTICVEEERDPSGLIADCDKEIEEVLDEIAREQEVVRRCREDAVDESLVEFLETLFGEDATVPLGKRYIEKTDEDGSISYTELPSENGLKKETVSKEEVEEDAVNFFVPQFVSCS